MIKENILYCDFEESMIKRVGRNKKIKGELKINSNEIIKVIV